MTSQLALFTGSDDVAISCEDSTVVSAHPDVKTDEYGDYCIRQALRVLEQRLRRGPCLNSPTAVKDFLRLRLAPYDYEVFGVIWLDAQQNVLEFQEMFRGTLTQTSVYPRELVREAIRLNAAACILTHNHPSGACEPSRSDEVLTQTLKTAMHLVDVRILDHIIVSKGGTLSMAEKGLI